MHFRSGLLSLSLAAAFLLYGPALAAAEGDVVTFAVGAGVTHDDNLFRTTTNEESDTISRLSAGVKVDLPVSLQRFAIDARVDDNRYSNFDQLNYVGGQALGNWDWQIGDRTSGKLGYRYQRTIADFGDLQTRTRDLISLRGPLFNLAYLLTPEWQLVGDASRTDGRHSDVGRSALDHQDDSGAVGVNYVTGSNNSVGLLVRRSNADYANRQTIFLPAGSTILIDNSFQETETSAVATWAFSGVSSVKARAGYTSRKHNDLAGRDFSGATGEIDYHWIPTGKTTLDLAIYRLVRSSDDLSASYVVFRGVSISPTWMPVSTVTLKLRAARELRDYNGDPGLVLGTTQRRADTFQNAQFSAIYAATRNIELSLALEAGKRTSNTAGFDYRYKLGTAAIKAAF